MNGVIVSFSGGLGNQLFQYAAGWELSNRLRVPLYVETEFYRKSPNRQFELKKFQLELNFLSGYKLYRSLGLARGCLPFLLQKKRPLSDSPYIFIEEFFEFDLRFEKIIGPLVYLSGYWQSERYFPECGNKLKKLVQGDVPVNVSHLLSQINENAVCVHIRRGDYTRNPEIAKVHGVCGADYYEKGIATMKSKLKNPRFFVFTDEPEAVSFVYNMVEDVVLVSNYSEGDQWAEFFLMQQFYNFIIANSTFSWWAAWSSLKEPKFVICPENWFADASKNTKDLYPATWLKY